MALKGPAEPRLDKVLPQLVPSQGTWGPIQFKLRLLPAASGPREQPRKQLPGPGLPILVRHCTR